MKQLSTVLNDTDQQRGLSVIQQPGSTRNAGLMKVTKRPEWRKDIDRVNTLRRSTASWLAGKYDDDYKLIKYRINGDVTNAAIIKAHDELASQVSPLSDVQIAKALIRLKALTVSRAERDGDIDIQIEAYTERLKRYPGSAVYAAMGDLVETSNWFPAWAELKDAIMVHCQHTMKALEVMERTIDDRS